jgi:hypothetical protein
MGHLTKKRIFAISLLLLLAACDGDEVFPNTPSSEPSVFPPTPVAASPTPPAVPSTPPSTTGGITEACVDGWRTPQADSSLARFPLKVIGRTIRMPEDPVIVDMRYFMGPESPPSEKGYLATVERWYVKLYSAADLAFQGRFLVESREFGDGVVAVAPYDTEGFRSPDWSGFQWNEADQGRKAYQGLPGRWRGTRYDFVRGGADLDIPGLPDEVRGCLDSA